MSPPDVDAEMQAKIDALKHEPNLVAPPVPTRPMLTQCMTLKQKLGAINRYIATFEYNHTGVRYFQLRRDRGLKHVTTTAKEIMREALPIQCVEAVFLAFFLTAEIPELERFPMSLKSRVDGRSYRHIVLAVLDTNKCAWGSLGISRRASLAHKELRFQSLSQLVTEFGKCYAECGHELVKVYVGLPLSHNVHSMEAVKWRVLKLKLDSEDAECSSEAAAALDQYAKDAFVLREHFLRTGSLPCDAQGDAGELHARRKAPTPANANANRRPRKAKRKPKQQPDAAKDCAKDCATDATDACAAAKDVAATEDASAQNAAPPATDCSEPLTADCADADCPDLEADLDLDTDCDVERPPPGCEDPDEYSTSDSDDDRPNANSTAVHIGV